MTDAQFLALLMAILEIKMFPDFTKEQVAAHAWYLIQVARVELAKSGQP